MKIYDISRPISKREPLYPGNASVILERVKIFSRDRSTLSSLSFGLHTATHLDAPLHYLKGGRAVERLPLEACIGWARVFDTTGVRTEISKRDVARMKPQRGEIILFKTSNSRRAQRRGFDKNFVHINYEAAVLLAKAKIKAVGIDGPSIRKFRLKPDMVHPVLLRAGILIYEGLDLGIVRSGRYWFIGLPLKIVGAEASPVRAILIK